MSPVRSWAIVSTDSEVSGAASNDVRKPRTSSRCPSMAKSRVVASTA